MESDNLYRVQEEDLPRLQKLLTVCFAQDPLYHTLIPDDDTRERLLPELFSCDLTEFFQTCEIYFWQQRTEQYPGCFWRKRTLQFSALLSHRGQSCTYHWRMADQRRSKPEKPSGISFRARTNLNSSWTDQLHQTERLHVIYLAVDPGHQHHGLAELLMDEVINYAQKHKMLISLETHNPNNVPIYEHFGFKTYGIVEKPHFGLKQYCMIREATV